MAVATNRESSREWSLVARREIEVDNGLCSITVFRPDRGGVQWVLLSRSEMYSHTTQSRWLSREEAESLHRVLGEVLAEMADKSTTLRETS